LRVAGRNSHVCSLTKAMSAPWIPSGCFGKNARKFRTYAPGEGALDVHVFGSVVKGEADEEEEV